MLAAGAIWLVKQYAAVIACHSLVSVLDLRGLSLGLLLFGIFSVASSVARLRPSVDHLNFLETSAHHAIIRILIRAVMKK